MAIRPTAASKLNKRIERLDAGDMVALARISALETDSPAFGAILAENPKLALAAKGIGISDLEATKIQNQIRASSRGPGVLAETEIGVTVKHKF